MKELFCDGMAEIVFSHGLVIFDLFHDVAEGGKPVRRESTHRVTIPLNGFLDLYSISEKAVRQMVDVGVYKATPENESAPAKPEKKAAKKPAPAKKEAAKPAAKPVA